MTVATVDGTKNLLPWQIMLGTAGVVAVAAGAVLEIVIVNYHSTSTVTKSSDLTTTVTGPSAPPAALVTACLGAGVVLLLACAFFGRISKIVITGIGEIDLDAEAALAGKAAAKSGGDPAKTERIYKRAVSNAVGMVNQSAPTTTRVSTGAQIGWRVMPSLSEGTLQKLVDDAAKEES
jgi:hypothetical protein